MEFLEAIPNLVYSFELVDALGDFGQNKLAVGDQQVEKPFIFFKVVGYGVAMGLNWVFSTGITRLQFLMSHDKADVSCRSALSSSRLPAYNGEAPLCVW
jgi:hypothetical protein